MARHSTRPRFEPRNETDLLRAAKKALPEEFSNPERLGCPEASTLEAIAERHLSVPDIDDLVDHIATCSQCFAAYSAYRNAYCSRRNRRRVGALMAVLAVMLTGWYLGRRALSPLRHNPEQIAEVAPLTAVLDFHNRTSERSAQAPLPAPQETPHLRRSLLNLQIMLPLGTDEGQYSVQIRNNAGGVAAQSIGTAKWDGTTETLSARVDLRTAEPGQYTLAVRKGTSSWHQYSIFLDEK